MGGRQIGLINDIHYGFPENKEPDWLDPALRRLVDRFNAEGVDQVVLLGDTIEHGDRNADLEHLAHLADLFDRLEMPLYAIPGNHDVINLDATAYVDRLGAANERPFFMIDGEDDRFIGLDTTHRDPDLHPVAGRLGAEQRGWLEDRLDTEKDVYIFSHHLLHHRRLEGNFYFDDKPELAIAVDKRSVTKMVEEHGSVRGVVSAHIHEEGLTEFHGVPHMTLGAMDKTDPAEGYGISSAVLTVDRDRFELDARERTYSVTF